MSCKAFFVSAVCACAMACSGGDAPRDNAGTAADAAVAASDGETGSDAGAAASAETGSDAGAAASAETGDAGGAKDAGTAGDAGTVVTSGTIHFHLLLGVGSAGDQLPLAGDGYTDLIMSNFIAGVMEGHLIRAFYPGIQYDKDYLYGSIMGQLLQENLETQLYRAGQDLIDPSSDQQAVMGTGQGGPYQINNYAVDMVAGSYAPGGHSLINFVALQKNLGYSMATASVQHTKATPSSFNDKYFGPMVTAYFHYLDFVAMYSIGKGTDGWVTSWEPAYDNALANFKTLPNAFLDVILNVAYNQGFYGGLVARYSSQGAGATASTVEAVRSFESVWGKTDTYEQYPYQVMYYLDQMYGKPMPTSDATTFVTPTTHIAFAMARLGSVFSLVFQKLAYVDSSNQYVSISSSQADAAFRSALSSAGVDSAATLDLSNTSERATVFTVLELAIGNLDTGLGSKLNTTSDVQL